MTMRTITPPRHDPFQPAPVGGVRRLETSAIPAGRLGSAIDELHADVPFADSRVAEVVIPFLERGLFAPAQVDVLKALDEMRERARQLASTDRAPDYVTYTAMLSNAYEAFLRDGTC